MIRWVLVVDKHTGTQGVAVSIHLDGFTVCGDAVNGFDPIEKEQELSLHLILLDFSMPGINGFEVAHELIQIMPQAPLVIFTNLARPHPGGGSPPGCDMQRDRNMDLSKLMSE